MPSSPTPRARAARMRLAVVALLACVGLAVLVSLAVGARGIPLPDVWAALTGGLDSDDATVVTSQRLPRTLLALAVGAALGVAGALMQGHTRNPLADPGLFGVNAGASFAVALLAFTVGVQSSWATVAAALVGAGVVSTVVFVFGLRSLRSGGLLMLAVIGTTLGALLTALTSALVLLDKQTLNVLRFWDVGQVSNREFDLLPYVVPVMAVGILLAVVNSYALNALGLGDEVAASLGHDVRRSRIVGIVAITLLAGTSTAMCGPIAFVGLVAPHAARAVTGHDYRWLVPFAGLCGAVLLLVADTLGRVAAPPGELEAGRSWPRWARRSCSR